MPGQWNKQTISKAREVARQRIILSSETNKRAALDRALALLSEINGHGPAVSSPECFAVILETLDLLIENPSLPQGQVPNLLQLANALLRNARITELESRQSFAYGELRERQYRLAMRSGEPWEAAIRVWQADQNHKYAPDSPFANTRFQAYSAVAASLGCFELYQDLSQNHPPSIQARLMTCAGQRLGGHLDLAQASLAALQTASDVPDEWRPHFEWESLKLQCVKHGDLTILLEPLKRSSSVFWKAQWILEANLFVLANPARRWDDLLLKASTVRRYFRDSISDNPTAEGLLNVYRQLEDAYDRELPLARRMDAAETVLKQSAALSSFEHRLMGFAAAARYFRSNGHEELFQIVIHHYRGLSLSCSKGMSDDSLQVFRQSDGRTTKRASRSERILQSLPTNRLKRSLAMGRLSWNISRVKRDWATLNKAKQEGVADSKQSNKLARLIESICQDIGKLKGPINKMTQILGLVEGVPEPLRAAFGRLPYTGLALPPTDLRRLIETELGAPIGELFEHFDEIPLATASIAQVHRARLRDGTEVAVKVKYPGIESAMSSDLKTLRMLTPIYRTIFPRANVDEVISVSEQLLLSECNLVEEARNQSRFQNLWKDYDGVYVPKVFTEFSTENILTVEFVEGSRLQGFIANGTQSTRDEAARTIFRTAMHSLFVQGVVHGDPHPGNFIFKNDGRIAWIDFGLLVKWSPERLASIRKLAVALLSEDIPEFSARMANNGYPVDPHTFNFTAAYEALRGFIRPAGTPGPTVYNWQVLTRVIRRMTVQGVNRKNLKLPAEDVAAIRFFCSVYALIAELGATIDCEAILRDVLLDGQRQVMAPAS